MRTVALLVLSMLGVLAVVLPGLRDSAAGDEETTPWLFETADRCVACHNGLVSPAGEEISIGVDWRSTMMANAARDPYWQAAVRRETIDHPRARAAIEDECSKCHMPMARTTAHAGGGQGQIFAHLPIGQGVSAADLLAADGVSCTVCHQIQGDNLGQRSSMVGGFLVDTVTPFGSRSIYGPYEVDPGRTRLMSSSSQFSPMTGTHIQQSELCATCHVLITHSLGPDGEVVGELPEQVPYYEWLHSRFPLTNSCQSCHMQVVQGETAIASVWSEPRSGFSQHFFAGGNFFIARLLNLFRHELGTAAPSQELSASARRTVEHLQAEAASLSVTVDRIDPERLCLVVEVANRAGHKLPSAYPSRRAWIQIQVRDEAGGVVFESGAWRADGSIDGNDNDADETRYEPHYQVIEQPDQVQIYEAILGAPDGTVTTGLLTATQYLKDNRLLPEGFDKSTASHEIAVWGEALQDADFLGGGDRVRYQVPIAGVQGGLEVEAQLWYQPIGHRWAVNLAPYDAQEPQRFAGYYQAAAHASAVVLARAATRTRVPEPPPEPQEVEAEEAVP
ncbi:MAG: hypothetical protein JW797_20495 [Bradymonadales bacterium]|nr:hypothetical protein [Bradymonadales bacterium]